VAVCDCEEGIAGTLAARIQSSLAYGRQLAVSGEFEVRLHSCPLYAPLFRYDADILFNPRAWAVRPRRALSCTCGSSTAARSPVTVGQFLARAGDREAVVRRGCVTGRIEYWNDPRAPVPNSLVPAAGIFALDGDGKLLLQRRRDTGQWAIPMGKQEFGETPSQCAVQETREEMGFAPVLITITGHDGDRTAKNASTANDNSPKHT
jgi:hypothetical protein